MSHSVQSQVADHYNQIRQKSREERQGSEIIGIKRFNNWVKSVLIHRFACNSAVALDLCCGKGGDLLKFKKANVKYLVGADHAMQSIKDAVQRSARRQIRLNASHEKLRALATESALTRSPLMSAVRRYNEVTPLPFPATFICADCHSARLSPALPPSLQFDLVSCQFALHYSFESESRARMFAMNIGERLRPGGTFVATFPNADVLQKRLKQAIEQQRARAASRAATAAASSAAGAAAPFTPPLRLEFGNSVYKVKFTTPCSLIQNLEGDSAAAEAMAAAASAAASTAAGVSSAASPAVATPSSLPSSSPLLPPLPASPFGVQYSFDLTDAISDCPEYMVHLPTLCSLLAAYDMEMVLCSSLHQFFIDHAQHDEYGRLLKQMKVLGNEYERPPTSDEWEVLSQHTHIDRALASGRRCALVRCLCADCRVSSVCMFVLC